MSKRELVPILRQSLLLCRDPLQRFLLLQAPNNVFSLPLFHSVVGQTFRQGLERGISELNMKISLIGIIRVEAGQSQEGRFYRCIYYATATSVTNTSTVFKTYEQLSAISLSSFNRSLLEEVHRRPTIYSINFFREKHEESTPMDSRRSIIVDI